MSVSASGEAAGWRQDASWWPRLWMNKLRCNCRVMTPPSVCACGPISCRPCWNEIRVETQIRSWREEPFAPANLAIAVRRLDEDQLDLGESAIGGGVRPDQRAHSP